MAIVLVITDAGRAALVNAANDGTRAVRVASCGVSPTATAPTTATTTLPGETKRIITVSGDQVAPDVIHLVVQDESMDTYPLRSLALYLDDGTLFAAYGQPTPIIEKSAQALMLLALDVKLENAAADRIVFGNANFLLPPATTERKGSIEIATDAEALALVDAVRALTPKALAAVFTAANVLARLVTVDGAGSGLDADLLDGRHGAEFALLTGAAFTGAISARNVQALNGTAVMLYSADNASRWYLNNTDGTFRLYDNAGTPRAVFRPDGSVDLGLVNALSFLRAGQTIWGADNDGAGSALDADLLDGQQGAWYTDIAARLGFTPLNAATFTAAAILSRLITVDGAGSGLDADLLDGLDASAFARLVGAAFTGAISAPTARLSRGALALDNPNLPFDDAHAWRITNVDDVLRFETPGGVQAEMHPSAGASFKGLNRAGFAVMDSGNDGAGSGFDADLLDGRHGSEYARITEFSSAANGYRVHHDGYKECWGTVYIEPQETIVVQLPKAHTAWCVPTGAVIAAADVDIGVTSVNGAPPDSFTVRNRSSVAATFYWDTRGY